MTRSRILLISIVIGAGIIIATAAFISVRHFSTYKPIPVNIKNQLSFSVYYPKQQANLPVNLTTIRYDTTNKALSFVIQVPSDQASVTVSEQSTPATFSDPQVNLYPKLLDKLNQYTDLSTPVGTVTLTRPKEYNGTQTAVLNSSGTLLFARPSKDLTNNQWQQLFNQITLLK